MRFTDEGLRSSVTPQEPKNVTKEERILAELKKKLQRTGGDDHTRITKFTHNQDIIAGSGTYDITVLKRGSQQDPRYTGVSRFLGDKGFELSAFCADKEYSVEAVDDLHVKYTVHEAALDKALGLAVSVSKKV